jgi:predicted transposase YdaD
MDENLWLKSLSDKLGHTEVEQISTEIARQDKAARITAYLHAIAQGNPKSIKEAIKMARTLTIEQVFEDVGWTAKWEARGKAEGRAEGRTEGEEHKALAIAQNLVNMGLPFETVVSATQLDPEKVKTLYELNEK